MLLFCRCWRCCCTRSSRSQAQGRDPVDPLGGGFILIWYVLGGAIVGSLIVVAASFRPVANVPRPGMARKEKKVRREAPKEKRPKRKNPKAEKPRKKEASSARRSMRYQARTSTPRGDGPTTDLSPLIIWGPCMIPRGVMAR